MRTRGSIPFAIRNLALSAALAAVFTPAGATLVADGKLGLASGDSLGSAADAIAEGYTAGWNVPFVDKNGKSFGQGQIWFGTDPVSGHQFIYYQLPLSFVDNSYGTNSSQAWTDAGKTHKFSDLTDSDSMGGNSVMKWNDANAGGALSTARIDYITDCAGDPNAATVCNSAGWKSAGVGPTGTGVVDGANGSGTGWGKNSKVDTSLTGSAASLKEVATSLEWNFSNIAGTFTANSSLDPNWIQHVGYELEFAAGTFDPATFGKSVTVSADGSALSTAGLIFGDPHVSPPIQSLAGFTTPCMISGPGGGCGVPEPGTTWLLLGGLAGMTWYARRRKDNLRRDALNALVPS